MPLAHYLYLKRDTTDTFVSDGKKCIVRDEADGYDPALEMEIGTDQKTLTSPRPPQEFENIHVVHKGREVANSAIIDAHFTMVQPTEFRIGPAAARKHWASRTEYSYVAFSDSKGCLTELRKIPLKDELDKLEKDSQNGLKMLMVVIDKIRKQVDKHGGRCSLEGIRDQESIRVSVQQGDGLRLSDSVKDRFWGMT